MPTSNPTIDPQAFRLSAFVEDWSHRLDAYSNGPSDRNQSRQRFALALFSESLEWLQIGQAIGYFASDAPLSVEALAASMALRTTQADLSGLVQYTGGYYVRDPVEFARDLSVVVEDLAPSRLAFLYSVFFEGESFDEKVRLLDQVASAVAQRPWLTFRTQIVDGIRWALDGAESKVGEADAETNHRLLASPAAWRIYPQHPAWSEPNYYVAGDTAASRFGLTQTRRRQIAGAMEWNAGYEQTPADLRASMMGRGWPGGDLEEDLPEGLIRDFPPPDL